MMNYNKQIESYLHDKMHNNFSITFIEQEHSYWIKINEIRGKLKLKFEIALIEYREQKDLTNYIYEFLVDRHPELFL